MIFLGLLGMRAIKGDKENFLVAGRRLGPFTFMSTFTATLLGGISTIGGVALGYQYGISGATMVFMYGLGLLSMGLFFNSKLSKLKTYTISETLGLRYGVSSKKISAVISVFYMLMVTVSQVLAMGTVFYTMFGLSPAISIIVGWSIILFYSLLGGMWSITLTDVVMFCIMTVGIFMILLPFGLIEVGGFSGLREALPESYFSITGIGVTTIFSYFLIFYFGVMVDQSMWQRSFTARSANVGKWGGVSAGVYTIIYGVAAAIIGSVAKVLYPSLTNPDNAFATMALDIIPVGLMGIVAAAALSALMSTSGAMLVGCSTTISNDLYEDTVKKRYSNIGTNRLFLILTGVVVLFISFFAGSVVGVVTIAGNMLASGLFFPVVGALFWKRSTGKAALYSMILGCLVSIIFMIIKGLYAEEAVIFGMLTNLIVFITISLFTKPNQELLNEWDQQMGSKQIEEKMVN